MIYLIFKIFSTITVNKPAAIATQDEGNGHDQIDYFCSLN